MFELFLPQLDDKTEIRLSDFAQMVGMRAFGDKWKRVDLEASYKKNRYSDIGDVNDAGDRGEFIKTTILDALRSGTITAKITCGPEESRLIAFNSFILEDKDNPHGEFARRFSDGPPPELPYEERESWLLEQQLAPRSTDLASTNAAEGSESPEGRNEELNEEILLSWEEFEEQYETRLTLVVGTEFFCDQNVCRSIDWHRSTIVLPEEQPKISNSATIQPAVVTKAYTLHIDRARSAIDKLAREPAKVQLGDWGNRYLQEIHPQHLVLIAAIWRIIAFTAPSGKHGEQEQILKRLIEDLDLSKGERPPGLSDERLRNIISEVYLQWIDKRSDADLFVNVGRPIRKSPRR